MKSILVNHGTKKEIMAAFGCTYPIVRAALNFKSNTPLSGKIRKAAINKGGRLVESTNN